MTRNYVLRLAGQALNGDFSTMFSGGNENPISEGGVWTMNGLAQGEDWANCAITSGVAHGVGPYAQFADPTALLGGTWDPDQQAKGIISGAGIGGSCSTEVELRLRSSISAGVNNGYEILWSIRETGDNYVQIVRWNGDLGDFTLLANVDAGPNPVNGDELWARVSGSANVLIEVFVNEVAVLDITDNSAGRFTSGNPGIGFYIGSSCLNGSHHADFGFTSFEASNL